MYALEVRRLCKTFDRRHRALDNIDMVVRPGEMVALIGASGSGKSTLIRHLAGLAIADRANDCSVQVLGEPVQAQGRLSRGARRVRARVGVIFQQFNLISRLSLLHNVLVGRLGRIPLWRGSFGLFSLSEKREAMWALGRVGMADFAGQRASTLSGGQQQRGAIARALMQGAEVLIADEPIASLDPKSARQVMETLTALNRDDGITVLVSLHQVEYAMHYCPRTIALRDGKVVYDGPSNALTPQFLAQLYGAESESLFVPGMADNAPPPRVALAAV